MSAVITQALVDLEPALRAAPRGQRVEIAQSTAQRLDMSLATLYRKLREVTADSKPRKRRSDAGTSALSREDAHPGLSTASGFIPSNCSSRLR